LVEGAEGLGVDAVGDDGDGEVGAGDVVDPVGEALADGDAGVDVAKHGGDLFSAEGFAAEGDDFAADGDGGGDAQSFTGEPGADAVGIDEVGVDKVDVVGVIVANMFFECVGESVAVECPA